MADAIERAEKHLNSRAVEATFTPYASSGGAHDVVVLQKDGTLSRVHIDGNSGSTVGVTDQIVASALTALTPEAVGGTPKSLLDAVKVAEARSTDHRAIGASASQDDQTISYKVTLATPTGEVVVRVGADGAILSN